MNKLKDLNDYLIKCIYMLPDGTVKHTYIANSGIDPYCSLLKLLGKINIGRLTPQQQLVVHSYDD